MMHAAWRVLAIAGSAFGAVGVGAAEPGRGFPFRGAPIDCVVVEHPSHHAKGDHRWFVTAFSKTRRREDGCTARSVHRYGQSAAWRVHLSCPGGTAEEDWALNSDGSITADRAGTKITYRACERTSP